MAMNNKCAPVPAASFQKGERSQEKPRGTGKNPGLKKNKGSFKTTEMPKRGFNSI
jgi:hypothetical protein